MSNRIDQGTRELLDAIEATLTPPPAAPHAWEERRQLLAARALYIRGVLGSAGSPDATAVGLAELIRQADADPELAVTYEIAPVDDEAVTP
ncbi:hypothetical protein [Nocardiopsis sp. YSL2]|uniref:hypothetical protein n=1 Tax=Nocardiopsis sp. YSL2 TaxID=2939492 RepID=UPI0026F42666|nr:hypothetical protein [Nocardiopsis sp. YSL2]